LVEWKGYELHQSSLVSESDVTEPILRYRNLEYNSHFFIPMHACHYRNFYNPNIDEVAIQQHANKFITEVNSRLESRVESSAKYIRIPFMHTVYYRLFGDKTSLTASDFSREFFHEGWDDSSESDVGVAKTIFSGRKVLYPILTHLYVHSTKKDRFYKHTNSYHNKPLVYVDMLRIFVTVQGHSNI